MGVIPPGASIRLAFAVSLALVAALVAGCGGGGEGDTAATTSGASTSPQTATGSQAPSAEQNGGAQSQSGSSSSQNSSTANLPPPQPGSKTAAPGVPTSKQGDNSIQTWGLEASDTEREAATATVQRYLDARAADNWSTACQLLAAKPRREQEQFGGGASCAQAMASFAADASPATLREEAEIEVLSFRVGDKYTFLIYRRPDGIFATALSREGGQWKLISVTPNPIE
jgi:hypothetical protein